MAEGQGQGQGQGQSTPRVDDDNGLRFDPPDDPAPIVSFVTHGGPLRSFIDNLARLVDEARFRFTDNGLRVNAVDPANVCMTRQEWPASAFGSYQLDSGGNNVVIGMPLHLEGGGDHGDLRRATKYARRGRGSKRGDPVRLDIYDDGSEPRVRVAILRPDQLTKRVSWFYSIDPAMLRDDPDDLNAKLAYRADPSPDVLHDVVESLDDYEHAHIGADGKTLVVGTQASANPYLDADDDVMTADSVELPNRAWNIFDPDGDVDDFEGALFSLSYLELITGALDDVEASRQTLSFDGEMPLKTEWQNTDWGIEGMHMVAPRIGKSDDD
jgi:hypothetical protein